MIARQRPQPPSRDGQGFVEGEFRRKIGHWIGSQRRCIQGAPSSRIGQISVESAQHRPDSISKSGLLKPHSQFVGGDLSENSHSVVVEVLPASR